jgi:hypothetical protein
MDNKFFSLQDDGVPSIIPPLEPYHEIGVLGQQINDLPFPFISPLSSDDHDIGHSKSALHFSKN